MTVASRGFELGFAPKKYLLPTLIFVLAPIDTIDLSGGRLDFGLSPVLILSLIFSALSLPQAIFFKSSYQNIERGFREHWPIMGLMGVIVISVLLVDKDPEIVAAKRAILVLWTIGFSAWLMNRLGSNFSGVFIGAAHSFVLLNMAVVLFELSSHYLNFDLPEAIKGFVTWEPGRVADFPRISGLVADPNRAAVLLVIMLGLCYLITISSRSYFRLPRWVYWMGTIQILLTVSRTGYVAGLLLLFVSWLFYRSLRLSTILNLSLLIGIGIVAIFSLWDQIIPAVNVALISATDRQGSTDIHFGLLATGLNLFVSEIKVFLIGIGWGTSYAYTQTFFPGNLHGNFHSGILTFATTTGVFGLTFYLCYMLLPLVRALPWASLAVCLVWANFFYEFHNELLFWVVLFAINSRTLQEKTFASLKS